MICLLSVSIGPLEPLRANETLELNLGGITLQALYRPHGGPVKRGFLILFPDRHTHMDWPLVIRPLASGLAAKGWANLSLNPVGSETQSLITLANQIQQRFNAEDYPLWVLLGFGSGARSAQAFYLAKPDLPVRALILVSAELSNLDNKLRGLSILDTVADRDNKIFNDFAMQRRQWGLDNQIDIQQRSITGADHQYTGLQDELLKTIQNWLHKRFQVPKKDVD